MSIDRAILIHAAVHWPAVADAQLWPMAVQQAIYLWNRMPSQVNGLSPVDIFTQSCWEWTKLRDVHVWGCPVYVLDHQISGSKKLPQWEPHSEHCIYV
jgi:hypothetical protein